MNCQRNPSNKRKGTPKDVHRGLICMRLSSTGHGRQNTTNLAETQEKVQYLEVWQSSDIQNVTWVGWTTNATKRHKRQEHQDSPLNTESTIYTKIRQVNTNLGKHRSKVSWQERAVALEIHRHMKQLKVRLNIKFESLKDQNEVIKTRCFHFVLFRVVRTSNKPKEVE